MELKFLVYKIKRYFYKMTVFTPNCRNFILSNTLLSFSVSSIEVFLSLYFLSLNFKENFIGTYYAVSTGFSTFFLLFTGKFSDKVNRIKCFYIACFGHLIGNLILFFSTNINLIYTCAILKGISSALLASVAIPFLHENAKPFEREYVFSASSAFSLFGSTLGNLFGGWLPVLLSNFFLVSKLNSYRYSIILIQFFIILALIPLLFLKNIVSLKTKKEINTLNNQKKINYKNLYFKFVLYNFLIGCGAGLIVPFFNIYFAQKFHLNSGVIGTIFMFANILTAFSMLLTPILVKKIGKIRSIVIMELLSLPFLILLGLSNSLIICIVAYLLRNALMNMNSPVFSNFTMENIEKNKLGFINSIITLGDNLSRTISTYVSGVLMTNHGVALPYFITALFYLMAAIFALISFLPIEQLNNKTNNLNS